MSKAELPSLRFDALMQRTEDVRGAQWIGHGTEVERSGNGVILWHHERIVALITEQAIALGIGDASPVPRMLAQRLNKVLHDNRVPYATGLRDNELLLFRGDFHGPVVARGLSKLAVVRSDDQRSWERESITAVTVDAERIDA